jgi:hypothetical protein
VIIGLSDHDAQLPLIRNEESISNYYNYRKRTRLIDNDTVKEFITYLSNENWNSILNSYDVVSDTLLNIFLRYFEASFLTKTKKRISENKRWITTGIKTSWKHKQDPFLNFQSSNNRITKIDYRKYGKILTKVIKQGKCMHYNEQILELDNKAKTVWKAVKKETEIF